MNHNANGCLSRLHKQSAASASEELLISTVRVRKDKESGAVEREYLKDERDKREKREEERKKRKK